MSYRINTDLDFRTATFSAVNIEVVTHVFTAVIRFLHVAERFLVVGIPAIVKATATDRTPKSVLLANESKSFSSRYVSFAIPEQPNARSARNSR